MLGSDHKQEERGTAMFNLCPSDKLHKVSYFGPKDLDARTSPPDMKYLASYDSGDALYYSGIFTDYIHIFIVHEYTHFINANYNLNNTCYTITP